MSASYEIAGGLILSLLYEIQKPPSFFSGPIHLLFMQAGRTRAFGGRI